MVYRDIVFGAGNTVSFVLGASTPYRVLEDVVSFLVDVTFKEVTCIRVRNVTSPLAYHNSTILYVHIAAINCENTIKTVRFLFGVCSN